MLKSTAIPFQPASLDIWEKKYRLTDNFGNPVDADIEATFKRVARALADLEEKPEVWYPKFLWALEQGCIPAGRIVSNAGAGDYKPATSTINCTVAGTIRDSMEGILEIQKQAGLTLRAGAGIGYEFSTLRPKGAFVKGAGAYTSGPLAFMDMYDAMCKTISSAGGRRGAQMGTFDVGHPDVVDFIRAKREDGRLRQFNLSLLITREFMEAVKSNSDWKLAFPAMPHEMDDSTTEIIYRAWPVVEKSYITNEEGLVACRVYDTIKAAKLWNMIMTSTYDFAEPGFILIDQYNEMNNNWFGEDIRATNPYACGRPAKSGLENLL